MQKLYSLVFLACIISSCSTGKKNVNDKGEKYPEEKLGWKLGAQTYTFNRFTFFEAVDKADSAGLSYVEAYPGQEIGGGIQGKMDHHMDSVTKKNILEKLKEKGMRLYAYGVVQAKDDADWRELFEFCREMNIETITSEPALKDMALISALCDEYAVNFAIHNHPEPSAYWNPEAVLRAIEGHSSRVGACADIGHWVRSGLEPVTCLKTLQGRVLHSHMKDLNAKEKNAHDVHWGTGVSDIPGVVEELKRQGFKGMISAEYEHNWEHNTPDVKESVINFRKLLGK